jgi:hypothetical protein
MKVGWSRGSSCPRKMARPREQNVAARQHSNQVILCPMHPSSPVTHCTITLRCSADLIQRTAHCCATLLS